MQRRAWILGGTLATGGILSGLWWSRRRPIPWASQKQLSHRSGPLALPQGFECVVLGRSGDKLSDGARSPNLPDGMACFVDEAGRWILLRNHELERDPRQGAYPDGQPDGAYDRTCQGGVSRLVLDPKSLDVLSSNMVLTGTLRNCAGGPTPWGFISCEEATEEGHGYAFLCRKTASQLQHPERLTDYGRFRREAVAFDANTRQAYLTEDEQESCLYRFTPFDREKPFQGKLEALRVKGQPRFATSSAGEEGRALPIDWVPVDDPEARTVPTRLQAQERGAALFSRGEGAWIDGDGMVFCATNGGRAGLGQIFRVSFSDQTLTLVLEAKSQQEVNGPDNITVAPWGDFVVAEDTAGPTHVYGITRTGHFYPILRNQHSESEIVGVCFSPDGTVLFCNLQWDGLTLAIRGPFEELFGADSES